MEEAGGAAGDHQHRRRPQSRRHRATGRRAHAATGRAPGLKCDMTADLERHMRTVRRSPAPSVLPSCRTPIGKDFRPFQDKTTPINDRVEPMMPRKGSIHIGWRRTRQRDEGRHGSWRMARRSLNGADPGVSPGSGGMPARGGTHDGGRCLSADFCRVV